MQLSLFKKCSKCKQTKLITGFGKSAGEKDGHAHICKSCRKIEYANNQEIERQKSLERYRSNKETRKNGMSEWYRQNKPKKQEYNKEYREKHKDELLEKDRAYYEANKDRFSQRRLLWQRNNKEKVRASHQRHRSRVMDGGGSFSPAEWSDLCDHYGNLCVCCKQKKPLTADHVIPVSKGGSSNIDNIQPLCRECNSRKCDRIIDYR